MCVWFMVLYRTIFFELPGREKLGRKMKFTLDKVSLDSIIFRHQQSWIRCKIPKLITVGASRTPQYVHGIFSNFAKYPRKLSQGVSIHEARENINTSFLGEAIKTQLLRSLLLLFSDMNAFFFFFRGTAVPSVIQPHTYMTCHNRNAKTSFFPPFTHASESAYR